MIDKSRRICDFYLLKQAVIWLWFYVESSPHIYRVIQEIKANGARAGLVLNPGNTFDCSSGITTVGWSGTDHDS